MYKGMSDMFGNGTTDIQNKFTNTKSLHKIPSDKNYEYEPSLQWLYSNTGTHGGKKRMPSYGTNTQIMQC